MKRLLSLYAALALVTVTSACEAAAPAEPGVSTSPTPSEQAATVDLNRPLDEQLREAIQAGDAGLVTALVDAGVDINVPIAGETTALHLAVTRNDIALVEAVLDAGGDVDALNDNNDPVLMLACEHGEGAEVITALLEAGADPMVPTSDEVGSMPIHICAAQNNPDGIVALVSAGVDVNQRQLRYEGTALLTAGWAGSFEAAEALLSLGADPTLQDIEGGTARDWADAYGHVEVVALIEQFGG
jgi:ankyrin repeat protein